MDHSTLWRLFYSNSIFDLQLDGDIATIGITAHAADALGDIVFVDLPAEGRGGAALARLRARVEALEQVARPAEERS